MKLTNPFERPGRWFKANLHTHTTTSDGDTALEQRIQQYRTRGYDVLAITDHRVTNDVTDLSRPDFLVISGLEAHPPGPDGFGAYHLICLDVPTGLTLPDDADAKTTIELIHQAGGEVIIGHPYWCGYTINQIMSLHDANCIAIEVYNATCTRVGKGFSSVHWDDLLDAGIITPALAVDDTHFGRDIFMGWTMIKAIQLTLPAIMDALRKGAYYASCGPVIEDFRIIDDKVVLRCSPVAEVHFISQRNHGFCLYADDGDPITHAERELTDRLNYIRAEVIDKKGNHAWTNPLLLNPSPC